MSQLAVSYKRHRFPPPIIAHAVWLYFRFPLSLRMVEEMLLERGIVVSYETIRCWGQRFGSDYVRRLRRKQPSSNDVWHLDEVVITISGRKHWLWRAVDQDGSVLDEIVQARRNTKAAKRLLTRLLKKQGMPPKRIITDKLRSYGAARRQVMPNVEHRSHKGLNNRAENSRRCHVWMTPIWQGDFEQCLSLAGRVQSCLRRLRALLVVGAHAALYRMKSGRTQTPLADWARSLLSKKPFKLVAVALANKMARIAWAVMAKDIDYEPGSNGHKVVQIIA